jgi:nitrate/TMAO reductase-like tetraheme cytochrome c subunit
MTKQSKKPQLLVPLFTNIISFIGLVLAITSIMLIVAILVMDWIGLDVVHTNPYIGIIVFLVLPIFLIIGLILVPVGNHWVKTKALKEVGKERILPEIHLDLNRPVVRRRVMFFIPTTVFIVALLSSVSYQAVEFMESTTFCGEVCHEVMEPELISYRNSPHSRVSCVDCHIGPGASWFVKSKLSGTRQVFAVLLNLYDKPIPAPIRDLRPARETCEQCHWPRKFHGEQLKVVTRFSEDENNTPLKTVLLMKTGGGDIETGIAEGIHWHMNIANQVTYVAIDSAREIIPWVKLVDLQGNVTEYLSADSPIPLDSLRKLPERTMDCMDCHNRPTHIYRMPDEAIDEAMLAGFISPNLPYVKKIGLELITSDYQEHHQALASIERDLADYYQDNYDSVYAAAKEEIAKAGKKLKEIYASNVFPQMGITWGTYPNNIGHMNFPGCFRCHDEMHESSDGKVISQDCGQCHELLAYEEENPRPVIEQLPIR